MEKSRVGRPNVPDKRAATSIAMKRSYKMRLISVSQLEGKSISHIVEEAVEDYFDKYGYPQDSV